MVSVSFNDAVDYSLVHTLPLTVVSNYHVPASVGLEQTIREVSERVEQSSTANQLSKL